MQSSRTIAPHPDSVYSIAISEDGATMVSGCRDNQVRLWTFPAGDLSWAVQLPAAVVSVAISPDGRWVAAATDAGAFLVDRQGTRPIADQALADAAESVAFHPTSGQLAIGTVDGTLTLCEPSNLNRVKAVRLSRDRLLSLEFAAEGDVLIVGSSEGRVTMIDPVTSATKLWKLGNPDTTRLYRAVLAMGDTMAAAVSEIGHGQLGSTPEPDRHVIVTWSALEDDVVDWDDGLVGHASWIGALAFAPHGMLLASGSADEMIKVWEPPMHELVAQSREHLGNVHSLTFSPDGRVLASASADRSVKLWPMHRLDYQEVTRTVPRLDDGWLLGSMLDAIALPGVDVLVRLSQDIADRLMTLTSDREAASEIDRLARSATATVYPMGLPTAVGSVLRLRADQARRNGWDDIAQRYERVEHAAVHAFAEAETA